ncbi:MAG: ABC transporter substrate-binding protein [Microthrixaceae bacterium]|nr:ABC transporter substrate-binding protein [Microthrixaceae bacterium]
MFEARSPGRGAFHRMKAREGVAAILVALLVSACSTAKLDESGVRTDPSTTTALVEVGEIGGPTVDPASGAEGPIASGDSPLKGMRGAAPGIRVTEEFRDRIRSIDPEVDDLTGAAEAYDIVMILSIAAESARSDAPGRINDRVGPTTEGGRECITFRRCQKLALTDTDLDYDGVSGDIELLENGDPGEAGYAIVEFTGSGGLRTVDQMTVQAKPLAQTPQRPDPTYGPPGDGVLRIGTLLPLLAADGATARAALAGTKLAVEELNNLGGVLGADIELVPDESGDGSSAATGAAVARLIDQGVDAVIGGTAYPITSVALGPLTDAGVILFSPTDTARALSVAPNRALFHRLAPPTDLEGQVLGTAITNDGYTRVAIASGTQGEDLELAADIAAAVSAASGTVTATVPVEPDADPAEVTQALIESSPQAIVLVTSVPTTAAIIAAMVVKGKSPSTLATYGTAANMTSGLAQLVGG